jgi:hypothetical protein
MTSLRLAAVGGSVKCEHGIPLYRSCAECEGRLKLGSSDLEIGYVADDDDDYDDPPEAS